jgi:RNA polymerase sigma-70 factor (ECF subfamily)
LALSEIDRSLLERCLGRKPKAWNDFVDRFMGLVVHVINHTARARSIRLSTQDKDDLAAEVFLEVIANDFAVLRNFRGQSSMATYLTVIARRVVVRELLKRMASSRLDGRGEAVDDVPDNGRETIDVLSDREQVERLLGELEGAEADVVRLYHLEGKSYYEISMATGMPENSIGPTLSRARGKLRKAGANMA